MVLRPIRRRIGLSVWIVYVLRTVFGVHTPHIDGKHSQWTLPPTAVLCLVVVSNTSDFRRCTPTFSNIQARSLQCRTKSHLEQPKVFWNSGEGPQEGTQIINLDATVGRLGGSIGNMSK